MQSACPTLDTLSHSPTITIRLPHLAVSICLEGLERSRPDLTAFLLTVPTWPVYNSTNPVMMQFKDDQITPIQDTFRAESISLLNSDSALLLTGR